MAWTAPMTAVANTAFTAAQFNTHVRDNLLETAPAKATSGGGRFFASSDTNTIVERRIHQAQVLTSQSTSSTSYTNLSTSGPTVTLTTGTHALVIVSAQFSNNTSDNSCFMSHEVSGATSISPNDDRSLRLQGTLNYQGSHAFLWTTLNAGSNTFQAKYRVFSGTGTWLNRRITVMAF
ncbi:hypothetical protein BJP40_06760 [Streptomyces sp. CC53]|uniref:hypothetical protein n=1 Tax=Streptomyces sp. CC53 TaxID=1906740 RepID=UPI0008DDCBBD|nr:hypothetical protein [Streptomyces sp. CC53]OII61222.1 hypothetical protein BJP40_06760 [Streptomyces sp. CC53]